ncbi:LamG domain-containing protein [Candidatus Woesearchaeota archaeon]|nr:LamG domain-containing protein [Candidatus Woesearchaeota archaeon]
MSKRGKWILIVFTIFMSLGFALTLTTITQTDFNSGTYNNTFYNGTAVQLNSSFSAGNYTSQVFDSNAISSWDSLSWTQEVLYQNPLPDNRTTETGTLLRAINMSDNALLLHMDDTNCNNQSEDKSGYFTHGTPVGVSCGITGKFKSGINFDGGGDYITLRSLNALNVTSKATVALWANFSLVNGDHKWLIVDDGAGYYSLTLNQGLVTTNRIWLGVYNTTSNWIGSNTTIVENEWYFIAASFDSSGTNRLYINGIEEANGTGKAPENRATALRLGKSGTEYFSGWMDEVAMWNRTLSAQEIQDIYKRGVLKMNVSMRSCSDSSCLNPTFIPYQGNLTATPSLNNSEYFQYKFSFETENASVVPLLYNVTTTYTAVSAVPEFSTYAILLILTITIGTFVMRKKSLEDNEKKEA